jgi:lipoyl(octanoyl) transferase
MTQATEREGMLEMGGGPTALRELWVARLGSVPYADALELQRALARARIAGELPQDLLLLLEHPPVVTLGRSAHASHLIASPEFLATHGIALFEVERGGDVTYHGPGQLVGYPIIDLKRHRRDLHWYLRQVEEALMRALAAFDIATARHEGFTGVWTADRARKIASIGVHVRDWVTWHGFALNVTTDLRAFDLMVPCGIAGVQMTSVARERGDRATDAADVANAVARAFGEVLDLTPRSVAPTSLPVAGAAPAPR